MSGVNIAAMTFNPSTQDGSTVGSYIVSSGGNVIDSTDVSGTEGLNVNVLNDIDMDVDGIYNVSTNADPDNIGVIAHTRAASPGDAEQVERTTAAAASSDSITPANVHGLDTNAFMHGYDGTNWNRVKVDSDGEQTVNLGDRPGTAHKMTAQSIGATSSELAATPLAGRQKGVLTNYGPKDAFIGEVTGVTIATGHPIPHKSSIEVDWDAAASLWAIATAASADMRIMEVA